MNTPPTHFSFSNSLYPNLNDSGINHFTATSVNCLAWNASVILAIKSPTSFFISGFQINSGDSAVESNNTTAPLASIFIASTIAVGKNLASDKVTFGPIDGVVAILAINWATITLISTSPALTK